MEIAYVSALSALAGSVVGGLASGLTSWMGVRAQAAAVELGGDRARRAALYREFILAASRAYGNAIVSSEPAIQEIVELYAMTSQMRVLSSPPIVDCADELLRMIIETYFQPNLTVREMHATMKDRASIDPLRKFSEVARDELHGRG